MIKSNSVHLKSDELCWNCIKECLKGYNEQLLFCIYKLLRIQQQLVKWRGVTEGIFIYSVISFEVLITSCLLCIANNLPEGALLLFC